MNIRTAWILTCKDLRLYARDRTALLLSLLLPVVLATIFASAMGGMGGSAGARRVKFLVEDLDRSGLSQMLVSRLQKSAGLNVELASHVRREVAEGNAPAALLIPHGYEDDVNGDRTPELKLYRDPGKSIEQQLVSANLIPILIRTNAPARARRMMAGMAAFGISGEAGGDAEQVFGPGWDSDEEESGGSDPSSDRPSGVLAADGRESGAESGARAVSSLVGLETENVAGGENRSRKAAMQSHAISGTAVMMLLFGLVACGGTLLEEQASGTLGRLQLFAATPATVLLGKFLFACIAGIVQILVLFAYGGILFDIPVTRDPVALGVHSLAVVFAATSLGVFLAVVCKTRKQLEGLSTLLVLVMSALGGSWFPLIATPEWYQRLGHFTLNAWAMDGYQAILWYGKGVTGIVREDLVLLGMAGIMAVLSVYGWKRRFEPRT